MTQKVLDISLRTYEATCPKKLVGHTVFNFTFGLVTFLRMSVLFSPNSIDRSSLDPGSKIDAAKSEIFRRQNRFFPFL